MIQVVIKAIPEADIQRSLDVLVRGLLDDVVEVLSETGRRVIAELQGYTAKMRPPVRAGGPPRPAHPGNWADITGDLRDKYAWHVTRQGMGVTLALDNTSDHAVFVDFMDGYFVLRGVSDTGGPVRRHLRAVIAEAGLPWQVRYA